jgi:hypothetical protein
MIVYKSEAKRCGAGDGNRTHAICLEGRGSTIELHPHLLSVVIIPRFKSLSTGRKQKKHEIIAFLSM